MIRTMTRPCSIDGCGRPHMSRGWCSAHYQRWYKRGDPLDPGAKVYEKPRRRSDPAERFWSKVDKGADDECWLWTASTDGHGYGQFWNGERRMPTHRWAYEQARGPIPEGLQLDHLCRVRRCVNPDHLEAVTQAENIRRGHRHI